MLLGTMNASFLVMFVGYVWPIQDKNVPSPICHKVKVMQRQFTSHIIWTCSLEIWSVQILSE